MKKSLYSLMLSDEVVRAVDRMAYDRGMSRSGLINRILAQQFSMTTPDMWYESVLDCVAQITETRQRLQLQPQPSASMLSLKSFLDYKYNPTIRYSVELFAEGEGYSGELRVSSRTQNEGLLAMLEDFFTHWAALESGRHPPDTLLVQVENGRFYRRFSLPQKDGQESTDVIGKRIGQYIHQLDLALSAYFHAARIGGGMVYLEKYFDDATK
ncbi:CopG family transcriptional regulator [Oscillospiraceae bacterium MB08-C2-2]|nr:CopG family transcriptional regulator [Oscillospiraceae bacterium MB08-C2-2]